MQTLAGVSANSFVEGFLCWIPLTLDLVLGIYVAYTGLIKLKGNSCHCGVYPIGFILYAPDYIKKSMTGIRTSVMPAYHLVRIVMPHSVVRQGQRGLNQNSHTGFGNHYLKFEH